MLTRCQSPSLLWLSFMPGDVPSCHRILALVAFEAPLLEAGAQLAVSGWLPGADGVLRWSLVLSGPKAALPGQADTGLPSWCLSCFLLPQGLQENPFHLVRGLMVHSEVLLLSLQGIA